MRINLNTIKLNSLMPRRIKKQDSSVSYSSNPFIKNYTQFNNIVFKGFSCAPSSFQIKDIKNLRCPVCGKIMLDINQINEYVEKISEQKGENLVEALELYEDESYITKKDSNGEKKSIYRAQKQEIVDAVKKLAIENPDLNLAQLVQLRAKAYLNNLIDIQLGIIEELESYVIENVASTDELSNIKSIIDKFKKQILGQSEEEFARKKFMYCLLNVVENKEHQKQINKIAAKMPNSDNDINSFFVKYSKGYSSKEIARRFISQTIPTTEHLIPQSTGRDNGYNHLFINSSSNYICDCSECNTSRGVVPFSEWMENIPDFAQNLQQYLEDIQNALDAGILDEKYGEYINDIIKRITKLSNGKIVLVKPKFKTVALKDTEVAKRAKLLREMKNKLERLSDKKRKLKEEIEFLEMHPQFKRIIQHKTLSERLQQINDSILKLQNSNRKTKDKEIENLNEEKNHLEKTIKIIEAVIPNSDEIQKQIDAKSKQIKDAKTLDEKITKLRNSISDEIELKQRLELLRKEKSRLSESVSEFGNINNAEFTNNNNVKRYNYLTELLMRSAEIYEKLSAGDLKNADIDKEILTIAQIAIHNQIVDLTQDIVVKRYTENKKINEISDSEEKIKKRLKEIDEVHKEISAHVDEIKSITKGETITEMENDIKMLKVDLEQIKKIKDIQKLRAEYESLGDLIDYNYSILNELKVYKKINTERFEELMGQFYIK